MRRVGGAYAFPSQAKLIETIRGHDGGGTIHAHFVGGRGCSKTSTAMLVMLESCLIWNPGCAHLWTEPTYQLCTDTFLREFKSHIPEELYIVNHSNMVVRFYNGSTIDVRSRFVDRPSRDMGRGPNYAGAVIDEAALGFTRDRYTDIDAAIRDPHANLLWNLCATTPRLNEYQEIVESDGHVMVHATSYDNPYLPETYASDLEGSMSTARSEQEVYGRFISLSGRIWDTWSKDPWPNGNILEGASHNHDEPYYLFGDLGSARSSWLIVQKRIPRHPSGHGLVPGYVRGDALWVATAEYTPDRDGSTDRICRRIAQDYGKPCRVVIGADINTRSVASGDKPMFYVRRHFGQSIPVTPIDGTFISDKEIQQGQLSYLIHDTRQRRRFVMAENMISHDPESRRGLKEVMDQDTWPDNVTHKRGEFLPKEGRLEHHRDAMLYGAVGVMAPPRFQSTGATAA
tara:strand:- start:1657 stop:3027 length:1371 start_codon:yes stop_codon:yes gene_type:complete